MLDTFKKATPEAMAGIAEEMRIRKTSEVFLFFPMGSQTDHLIMQQVAKLGVFVLAADPSSVSAKDVIELNPLGIFLSGGPASVVTAPPKFDSAIFDIGIPVFGICLGFQMWTNHIGAQVKSGEIGEFGVHDIERIGDAPLLRGVGKQFKAMQSHGDEILQSDKFRVHAISGTVVAAGAHKHLCGVQFHPEVSDTPDGPQMFHNFVFGICRAKDRFPAQNVAEEKIAKLRQQIGDKKVLVALSAGCDSSVAAHLLKHATNGRNQLLGVYIRGIDRPDDEAYLHKHFGNQDWIKIIVVDATREFLAALAGKTSMPDKRLAVRHVYKPILELQAQEFGASFIAQGTTYTDLSESGGGHASGSRKAKIKQHHNTNLDFSLPELTPLDDCVKDGVREIGRTINVSEELLMRHPFPGPGQVVRNEGEITDSKLAMSRHADDIFIGELRKAGIYESVWQAGAVVTQSEHTFTKGDDAGSGPVIALWAVWSVNGFTAQAAELPYSFLKYVARRIGNEVRGVGAVVYRISDKPFSTIEWG